MPALSLTAQKVKAIKAINGKRTEYWDTKTKGLALRVTPKEAKSWTILYYRQSDGKQRRLTLGKYPAISLADARIKAREFLTNIEQGQDPAGQKQERKNADSFEELAEFFMERYAKKRKKSHETDQYRLNKYVLPVLGGMKAAEISKRDIVILLDEIADRGAGAMSNQILALIRKIFNWAVEEDLLKMTPAYGIKQRHKEVIRDRYLSPDEIRQFWENLDKTNATQPIRTILRLALLTGQRVGEISGIHKNELDLENKVWNIPKGRTKNKKPHSLPLAPMALELLEQACKVAKDQDFVFPSPRRVTGQPISPKAASKAMNRPPNKDIIGLEDLRVHDLRRTMATHMTKLKIDRLHVSKVLNHTGADRESVTGMVYDQNAYNPEKKAALERWENYLASIINKTDNNIISIGSKSLNAG